MPAFMRPPGPPSPQPNTIYNGPHPPIAYDENWQFFTNLTSSDVAWFQSQPEWLNFKAYVALSPTTASAATPIAVVNSALQAVGQTPMPPGVVTVINK